MALEQKRFQQRNRWHQGQDEGKRLWNRNLLSLCSNSGSAVSCLFSDYSTFVQMTTKGDLSSSTAQNCRKHDRNVPPGFYWLLLLPNVRLPIKYRPMITRAFISHYIRGCWITKQGKSRETYCHGRFDNRNIERLVSICLAIEAFMENIDWFREIDPMTVQVMVRYATGGQTFTCHCVNHTEFGSLCRSGTDRTTQHLFP